MTQVQKMARVESKRLIIIKPEVLGIILCNFGIVVWNSLILPGYVE